MPKYIGCGPGGINGHFIVQNTEENENHYVSIDSKKWNKSADSRLSAGGASL